MNETSIKSFVDGKPVDGRGERFETLNPATGQPFASVYDGSAEDVEAAVC